MFMVGFYFPFEYHRRNLHSIGYSMYNFSCGMLANTLFYLYICLFVCFLCTNEWSQNVTIQFDSILSSLSNWNYFFSDSQFSFKLVFFVSLFHYIYVLVKSDICSGFDSLILLTLVSEVSSSLSSSLSLYASIGSV